MGVLWISNAVVGMFMVELQFYTRHAENVFTAARAVSNKWFSYGRETVRCMLLYSNLITGLYCDVLVEMITVVLPGK